MAPLSFISRYNFEVSYDLNFKKVRQLRAKNKEGRIPVDCKYKSKELWCVRNLLKYQHHSHLKQQASYKICEDEFKLGFPALCENVNRFGLTS